MDPLQGYKASDTLLPAGPGPIIAMRGGGATILETVIAFLNGTNKVELKGGVYTYESGKPVNDEHKNTLAKLLTTISTKTPTVKITPNGANVDIEITFDTSTIIKNELSVFNKISATAKGIAIPTIQSCMYYPAFFQPQITGLGCGRFALNNLFHNERFTFKPNVDFQSSTDIGLTREEFSAKYTQTLSTMFTANQINLSEVCHIVSRFLLMNGLYTTDNSCRDDEYFSMDVIQSALQIVGHEPAEVFIGNKAKEGVDMANFDAYTADHDMYVRDDATNSVTLSSDTPNLLGYIINYGKSHYVALRKIPNTTTFEYLDSMASGSNKKDIKTTKDFLIYVTTLSKKIVSIRQVLNVTQFINPFESMREEYEKATKEDDEQGKIKRTIIKLFADNYQKFIRDYPQYTNDIVNFLTTFEDYEAQAPVLQSLLDNKSLIDSNTNKLIKYMINNKDAIQKVKTEKANYLREQRSKGSSSITVGTLPQAKDIIAALTTEGGKRRRTLRQRPS